MANSVKIFAVVLLLVLPLITLGCQVSVSQKLSKSKGSSTNSYTATIQNIGTSSASNVQLVSSSSLSSISGLTKTTGNTYELPSSIQKKGGIAAGDSYTFTYTIKKSKSVTFTATCTDGETPCSTMAPTSAPAKATKAPTVGATKKATTAPTTTKAAGTKATTAPTTTKAATKATSAPTKAATTAPKAATTAPSKAATSGSNTNTGSSTTYKKCPAGTWWQPTAMTTWQWQLTGTIDRSVNVQMYDIDLFDNTAATISNLHADGRFVICYFSTQYEDWRPDAASWPKSVIGSELDGWEGENFVDIRSSVVRNLLAARMSLAASKGCDGVEPDNVDGYTMKNGFSLTAADQLDFNKWLATTAHSLGLSIGLKNDLDQAKALEPYFDWHLDEQCGQYGECSMLKPFTDANKPIFNAEYSGSASSVCPKMVTSKISALIKNLDLSAKITAQCCTYATGGCTSAPYTCGSSMSRKRSLSFEAETEAEAVFDAEAEVAEEEYVAEETETFEAEAAQAQEGPATNSAAHATVFSAVAVAVVALAALL